MRHIDLCQSNPLKQAKQILYNFYHQSLDQINNPVELTRLYSQTCNQLDKIIPTNIRITRQVSTQLPNYSNILVVANHINTTYLTQLTSPKLIQQLNIQHDPLHSPGLLPIIFRQYPIDNFLSQYHLSARFINGLPPKILAQLSYAWGSIHVPGLGDNRTQIVIDQIESTLNPKDALVIFPEGKNTAKKYFG